MVKFGRMVFNWLLVIFFSISANEVIFLDLGKRLFQNLAKTLQRRRNYENTYFGKACDLKEMQYFPYADNYSSSC